MQSILHQMMEGPKVKLSGDDCASESIELAEQTCEVPNRQKMPIVLSKAEKISRRTLRSFSRGTRNCIFFELT